MAPRLADIGFVRILDIVVIGAGLSTALKLQETGRDRVAIVAEVLPNDPKHINLANQTLVSEKKTIEKETFEEMWKLSETSEAKECFRRIEHFEYTSSERDESEPTPREYMPEFRYLDRSKLPSEPFHVASGEFFYTITIDVPAYLPYLLSHFLFAGGRILRGSVLHLSQIAENGVYAFLSPDERSSGTVKPEPPAGIVVCVGLGARWLGGVEDEKGSLDQRREDCEAL
ncbi:hypothetical protein DFP72DRAFT_857010 [Ephemerocybe angulata]|uniref:FAD dependent oxidoreductase domain-containing protein n=1 Tax=Ephemerocybe angulata TaxID=980116 RepID=A0A8H6HFE7_9AGAR|nr:hypothetical protein DFP72DRAFT_857010 [Tulosesus angulatus]